ncbi:hypothetical protein EJB05_51321 [Eragrostis curvula]|uniref:Bifunctional inhibitor/plant lipid transfer protein/seed storage helical domain-containing protein n=1 Tax=Eragrostis curvula TaxID=38414 RepID=A0A5J9SVY6_9POAL|nr:hypothetical protein EJB05_51321 [Eragrostis curvula]
MASTAGLLVLLLGLLAGVAGDATAAGRCAVAADVAQSCARGVATPECCRSVAAISGGDCLCRDMAGLDLLALHAACGGARRLPTACKALSPAPLAAAGVTTVPPSFGQARPLLLPPNRERMSVFVRVDDTTPGVCDSSTLTTQILNLCKGDQPSAACCYAVTPAVDVEGCICMMMEEERLKNANITADTLVSWYRTCVGKNPNVDPATCSAHGGKPAGFDEPTPSGGPTDIYDEELPHDEKMVMLAAGAAGLSQATISGLLLIWKLAKLIYHWRKNTAGGH